MHLVGLFASGAVDVSVFTDLAQRFQALVIAVTAFMLAYLTFEVGMWALKGGFGDWLDDREFKRELDALGQDPAYALELGIADDDLPVMNAEDVVDLDEEEAEGLVEEVRDEEDAEDDPTMDAEDVLDGL